MRKIIIENVDLMTEVEEIMLKQTLNGLNIEWTIDPIINQSALDERTEELERSLYETISRIRTTLNVIANPYPGLSDARFKVWAIKEAKTALNHYENNNKKEGL